MLNLRKIKLIVILKNVLKLLLLIKNDISKKLINGPINKNNFLNKKYLGITEYTINLIKKNLPC